MSQDFYAPVDPAHIKKERKKAKELRQTQWWKLKLAQGLCHYCSQKFDAFFLTMDHVVPIGRGGRSTEGNVVVSCKDCNSKKKTLTPFEIALETLEKPQ